MQLCQDNRDLRLEMTATKELIVMGPTTSETGRRNAKLTFRLCQWAEQDGTGVCSIRRRASPCRTARRSRPTLRGSCKERYEASTEEEREQFAPLCPDFVAGLRSKADRPARLPAKMAEYVENGARLGRLLDPAARRVYIYRPGHEVKTLENPEAVEGDPVLPGFQLQLNEIR